MMVETLAPKVAMFSVYCERKFEVEPVEVIYPDGKPYICPDLSLYQMVVPLSYITSTVGVSLSVHEVLHHADHQYCGRFVGTSVMPGILKTAGHNKDHPKPIKIFEVGDVVLLNETKDAGASNRRYLAALYFGSTSGFELIHGLVDRIMEVIGTPFVSPGDKTGYYIQSSDEPEFLPGRQANFIYKGKQIGTFGIVHPQVLDNFDIPDPCSFVELDIKSFL